MPISLGFWEWGCPKRRDAHITSVLGMGMSKTQGCPYHCNSDIIDSFPVPYFFRYIGLGIRPVSTVPFTYLLFECLPLVRKLGVRVYLYSLQNKLWEGILYLHKQSNLWWNHNNEQYFPLLYCLLCGIRWFLTLNLWVKYWSVTTQIKATVQYVPVVLFTFLHKLALSQF